MTMNEVIQLTRETGLRRDQSRDFRQILYEVMVISIYRLRVRAEPLLHVAGSYTSLNKLLR